MTREHQYDGDRCQLCGCNWFDVSYFAQGEDPCPGGDA